MNKLEQLNAMSDDLHTAIEAAWHRLALDEGARAAVLTRHCSWPGTRTSRSGHGRRQRGPVHPMTGADLSTIDRLLTTTTRSMRTRLDMACPVPSGADGWRELVQGGPSR